MKGKPIQQDVFRLSGHIESALNLTSVGLLVLGKDRKIVGANPAARSLLNLPPDALGRDLADFVPEVRTLWHDEADSQPGEFPREFVTSGQRRVLLDAFPPDEQGLRVVTCREAPAACINPHQPSGREQLIRLSHLVSRLSHEVRNPLASILAGLQALERAGSLSSDDLFILGLVIGEARVATRIIERFSASVRMGAYTISRTPVRRLMQDCVARLDDASREKECALKLIPGPLDASIAADEQAMGLALGHLLQNGLDACERGGSIETGWRVLTEEEKQAIFPQFPGEVLVLFGRDNGRGLPSHLPRHALFEPLVTTKPAAAGLGLPMARHIVECHGGVLALHPLASGGTEFDVFLPRGARSDCWEATLAQGSPGGGANPCDSCDVKLGKTSEFCWAVKGRLAGPRGAFPPKACAKCAFFGTFNLGSLFKPSIDQ